MHPFSLQRRPGGGAHPRLRHAVAAILATTAAALPAAGVPMAPEGQPFVVILAIGLAAWWLGRGPAISASVAGVAAGALLLPGGEGESGQAMVALLPLPMIALGMTGAGQAFGDVFRIMATVDERSAAEQRPAAAPALQSTAAARPLPQD